MYKIANIAYSVIAVRCLSEALDFYGLRQRSIVVNLDTHSATGGLD